MNMATTKRGKGRPQGAEKIHICISLPVRLNNQIHVTADERGMTVSSFLELAARNSLNPSTQKTAKAPKLLKSSGYDHFRNHMRRNLKNAGGKLVLTANEVKGEVSDSGILYRTSQRDAYLARLMADELLDVRCEFGTYIFETVEWQQQKKSDDAKREKEAREKAYTEVEQAAAPETKLEAPTKTEPETPAKPKEAEPTPEDWKAHKKYLELAAKAEADDDQRRRDEKERKDEEQMIRYRKMMMGIKD
jgi:hypothetical protein